MRLPSKPRLKKDAPTRSPGPAKGKKGKAVENAGTRASSSAEARQLLLIRVLEKLNRPGPIKQLTHDILEMIKAHTGVQGISLRIREGEDFPFTEIIGLSAAYPKDEGALCARGPDGKIVRDAAGIPVLECLCGAVLQGRIDPTLPVFTKDGSFWTNDLTHFVASTPEAHRPARMRNRCHSEGYRSVALIPLRSGEDVAGLLQLNDKRPNRFNPDIIRFLESIGSSIAITVARKKTLEALTTSQALLRAVVSGTSDAVYVKDISGRYLFFNDAAAQIIGKAGVDAGGLEESPLFPPDQESPAFDRDLAIIAGGRTVSVEETIATRSGKTRTYLSTKGPLFDDRGSVNGMFTIAHDITERTEMEEALRASHARFLGLFESASLGIFHSLPEGRFLRANPALASMLGYESPDDLIRNVTDIRGQLYFHPERHPIVLRSVLDNTGWTFAENEYRRKDGTPIIGKLTARRVLNADGSLAYIEGYIEDITERRQAEDALRASEEQYRELADSITDVFFEMDGDLRYTYWNKASEHLLGIPAREALGKSLREVFPDTPDIRKAEQAYRQVLATQRALTFQNETSVGGQHFLFEITAYPSKRGLSVFVKDITERRRVEDALQASRERYRQLVEHSKIGIGISYKNEVVFANPALLSIFGYDRLDDFARTPLMDHVAPSSRKRIAQLLENRERGDVTPAEFEYEILRKDGQLRTLIGTTSIFREGDKTYTQATFQDITGRKRAEAALQESEKRLQNLKTLHESLLEPKANEEKLALVAESVVKFLNADFARIWMIKPGDRCEAGCIHAKVADGPHACRFRDRCLHLLASAGRYTHIDGRGHGRVPFGCYKIGRIAAAQESHFLAQDVANDPGVHDRAWAKELGLVSFAGYRLADIAGAPIGVLALFSRHVISAEEDLFLQEIANATSLLLQAARAEEALRESEARFKVLFDNAVLGLYRTTPDGKILMANQALCRMLGYESLEELQNRNLEEDGFNPGYSRDRFKKEIEDKGIIIGLEASWKLSNGGLIYVSESARAIKDSSGRVLYYEGSVEDITERHQTRQRERLANEVLGGLNQREPTPDVIRNILQMVKKSMGFEAVGIRLRAGDDFPYYETCGFPDQFVEMERSLCAHDDAGRIVRDAAGNPVLECMCGNILSGRTDPTLSFFTERGSFWSNCTTDLLASMTEKDRQARTRNRCNGAGYESVALIPLLSGDEIIGLLQLNDHRKNQFTPEMIRFFEGLGASIGIALARAQAEEGLRKSEEKFKSLSEQSPNMIFINRRGLIVYANDVFSKAMGYSREEYYATDFDFRRLFLPESEKVVRASFDSHLAGREVPPHEIRLLAKTGREIDAVLTTKLIDFENDKAILGILTDITKQKRIQEALRQGEERFRHLVENMSSGVAVYEARIDGRDFIIKDFNRAAERIEGVARQDILGRSVLEVFPGVVDLGLFEVFRRVWRTGEPEHLPAGIYRDDRVVGWRENYIYRLPSGEVVAIYDDVTERQKAENEIRSLNIELEERVRRRTASLEAANRELEAFAYSVSHDLRAPLRTIDGFALALEEELRGRIDSQTLHYLDRIRLASQDMARLIADLLKLSRVTRTEMTYSRVDLSGIVEKLVTELQAADPDRRVEWVIAPGVKADGDPQLLESALRNLLENAHKFTAKHPSSRIEFGVQDGGGHQVCFVRDDGAGFDMAYADRLFNVFQRLHKAEDFEGTGVGLAIVQRIILRHGGRTWAEGAVEKGATFYFSLAKDTSKAREGGQDENP